MRHKILIDWLEWTSKTEGDFSDLSPLKLNQDDMTLLPHGGLGYLEQMTASGCTVYTRGNQGMGTHFKLSGKGCRLAEGRGVNLVEVAKTLVKSDRQITRLDLALDLDYKVTDKLVEALGGGNYQSRWRGWRVVKGQGTSAGFTVYLGSRSSAVMARVYDKALEQKLPGVWDRIELELKKPYASRAAAMLFRDSLSDLFCGILSKQIRIIEPYQGNNKARARTARWWDDLLGDVRKVTLYEEPEERTLEDLTAWLERQVAPSLFTLAAASGNLMIDKLIADGGTRLSKKHEKLIQEAREMNFVTVTGHCGADPKIEWTKKGTTVAKLSVADTLGKEEVQWIPVVCYGALADAVGLHVKKGDKITAYGGLRVDSYEKDGETKYFTKVLASRIEF